MLKLNSAGCRSIILLLSIGLCGTLSADEQKNELAWPTNRDEALTIVQAAQPQEKFPADLQLFNGLNRSLKGTLAISFGEENYNEPIKVELKVTQSRYLVLSTEHEDGLKSHDIYAFDSDNKTYRRWSVLPWDEFATLEGDRFLPRYHLAPPNFLWSGTLFKKGRQTGTLVVRESLVSPDLPYPDEVPAQEFALPVFSRDTLRINEHGENKSSKSLLYPSKSFEENERKNQLLSKNNNLLATPKKETAEPKEPYRFDKENFIFEHPSFGNFLKVEPTILGPDTTLALVERNGASTSIVQVIAEVSDPSAGFDRQRLKGIAQSFFKSSRPTASFQDFADVEAKGITFSVFSAKGQINNRDASWFYGVAAQNGFFYQVILSRNGVDIEKYHKELLGLLSGFSQIDPKRLAMGQAGPIAKRYQNETLGIQMNPESLQVFDWDKKDLLTLYPQADYGFLENSNTGAFLFSIDMGGLTASEQDLKTVLLTSVGMDPTQKLLREEEWTQGTGTGVRYQQAHPQYLVEARVLRNGEVYTVLFAFTSADASNSGKTLSSLLDLAVLTSPQDRSKRPAIDDPIHRSKAIVFNDLGYELLVRGELSEALSFFERAQKLAPQNAVIAGNFASTLMNLGEVEELITWLDGPGAAFSDQTTFSLYRANALRSLGKLEECRETMATVFSKDERQDDALLDYITLLLQLGDPEAAVEVVDHYISRHSITSTRILRWQYQTYREAGLTEKELKAVCELAETAPKDSEVALDLVIALNNNEQFDRALEQSEVAKKISRLPNPDLAYQQGVSYVGKKDYGKAKELFEEAVELNPEDLIFQEGLQFASTMLGQGDNSDIKAVLPPVSTPEAVLSLLNEHEISEEEGEGFHSVTKDLVTGFYYQPGEKMRRTDSTTVKVLTRAGVESYKTIRFSFDPSTERAHLNYLKVYDSSGELVAEGKPEDYYASERNENNGMATRDKVVSAPVPGLKPGYTISYQFTLEDKGSSTEFPFERFLLASFQPSGPSAVFVVGAVDEVTSLSENAQFLSQKEDHLAYWILPQPPRAITESMLPRYDKFLPALSLGPVKGDWSQVSVDYLDRVQHRLTPDEEVAEQARDLTKDLETREEKTKAILDHVQKSLAYQAIEFGPRGQIPNPCREIIANRYGDCKDHSLLAMQLLQSIDVEAHLALVDSTFTLRPEIPSLDQFDHMILFLPDQDGGEGRFVDLTSKFSSTTSATVDFLTSRTSLILDGKGTLKTIPPLPLEENQLAVVRQVKGAKGNQLTVTENVVLHGRQASWLRSYLSGLPEEDYEKTFENLFANERGLEIDSVKVTGLQDMAEPCEIQLAYSVDRAKTIPHPWANLFLGGFSPSQRENPFHINDPLGLKLTVHFTGESENEQLWESLTQETKWSHWQTKASQTDQTQTLEAVFELRAGSYPPELFSRYVRGNNEFLDSLAGSLTKGQKAR